MPGPTVYEVAERAAVSTATVSRVLAGHDRVRPATRDRVLAAVAELGYVQSGAARDLARQRTSTLALCFPDPGVADEQREASLWYDEVIRGMERAARLAGYMLLIATTHGADAPQVLRTVSSRCDGMVVVPGAGLRGELRHVSRHTPVVVLGGDRAGLPGVDGLTVANRDGSFRLTRHLVVDHARRRPVFVAGRDAADSDARFAGYREALLAAGVAAPDEPDAVGDMTTGGGYLALRELLRTQPDLDAVVCVNDQTAVGAAAALRDTGRAIGRDVAVTGFDGVVLARTMDPPLTTVEQPMSLMGERAVELLLSRARDTSRRGSTVQLPVAVRIGASCGCPSPDPVPVPAGAGRIEEDR